MQFLTPLHNLVQGILAACSMLNCEKQNLREQPCNLSFKGCSLRSNSSRSLCSSVSRKYHSAVRVWLIRSRLCRARGTMQLNRIWSACDSTTDINGMYGTRICSNSTHAVLRPEQLATCRWVLLCSSRSSEVHKVLCTSGVILSEQAKMYELLCS